MAKYRHREFEMYEFRDEATSALTPKSNRSLTGTEVTDGELPEWNGLQYLEVSRPDIVTHVVFKGTKDFGDETIGDLRQDLSQLSDRLDRDSKVLFDFEGVESFSLACIDALALFNRRLKNKGSRIALCCLGAAVHASFF